MCSIMGYTGTDLPLAKLMEGFIKTESRGPDMSRVIPLEAGTLFFHRLAIMGLDEAGMQPFQLGDNWVVCNGELYGFRPVKAKLQEKGYVFASDSDCEIILPLYHELGLGMFATLDAEFAMIIYDAKKKEFIAARDPIGIRPLFYGTAKPGKSSSHQRPKT